MLEIRSLVRLAEARSEVEGASRIGRLRKEGFGRRCGAGKQKGFQMSTIAGGLRPIPFIAGWLRMFMGRPKGMRAVLF